MARSPRLALAGELHYVMQRGHNRQDVFVDDRDRAAFLAMLRDAAQQCGVAIHAYVLLDTEVHCLATPRDVGSLSRLMQSMGRRYVTAFNHRHNRSGTLWAGRFRAGLIDGVALGADALVHVESLPVRMGLVAEAGDWPWSSAAHHVGRVRDPLIVEHTAYWLLGNTPFERESAHAHRLQEGVSVLQARGFERALIQGRAVGSPEFGMEVAKRSGLPLRSRRRGRPARKPV